MLDKESLSYIILSQEKAPHKIGLKKPRPHLESFQRDKESLIRQILSFRYDKFSQKNLKAQGEHLQTSTLRQFFIKPLEHPKQQNQRLQYSNEQQSYVSPINTELYFNEYHDCLKKEAIQSQKGQNYSNNEEKYGVIDLFLKEQRQISVPLKMETVTNAIKCQNKSFNESTMAVSKLQRSSLSPHRTIRKTQNYNPLKLPDISQNNNSDSLFDLTENQSSSSPPKKQQQYPKKDQIKKVSIDLNHPKHKTSIVKANSKINVSAKEHKRMEVSLEEVEQYDELFDCSSQKQQEKSEGEREGIFNYLKNKIIKQKLDKSQKILGGIPSKDNLSEGISSNGESLNSFHSLIQRQKKEVHQKGINNNNIGMIVDQTIKAVNRNIMQEAKNNEDNNISSEFFQNASNPSTVQKLDERSNDKSQLLRNLQDLGDYSISAELFKKIEAIQPSQKGVQSKHHKQVTIDISNLCDEDQVQELFDELAVSSEHDQSSQNPCMPSFKMQASIKRNNQNIHSYKDQRNDQIKRVQIEIKSLEPSKQAQLSQVNLDDLSNYQSDDSSFIKQQSNAKTKSKIILKSANLNVNKCLKKFAQQQQKNIEKQFIEDLKHDISQLKNKIQASFISQISDLSVIKQRSNKKAVKISIDLKCPSNTFLDDSMNQNRSISKGLNQLKNQVNDLQAKMLKDAGIRKHA